MTIDEAYHLKGLAITEKELADIKIKQANDVIVAFFNDQQKPKVVMNDGTDTSPATG